MTTNDLICSLALMVLVAYLTSRYLRHVEIIRDKRPAGSLVGRIHEAVDAMWKPAP